MHNLRTPARRRTAVMVGAVGLGLTVTLSACGGNNSADNTTASSSMSDSTTMAATAHNDADVTFATEMIAHHKQALAMVDLTEGRTLNPAVQTLADDIRAAQTPEIQTMTGWLSSWGMPSPSASPSASASSGMGDMSGMPSMSGSTDPMGSMGSSPMAGMMTDEEMTKLKNASDADFQKMWLEMMIKHHQGAVDMARTEQSDGQYQPAIDLAGQIIASQSKQIDTMRQLLRSA
ncbi:DUF305 domain-containing protein [Nocardioides sp. KR10-350]|jgi:uncharacterized protein (DUF305 family)|uniref:DUF305 domain-containing protein n=1 Tax=Nocardioides cheoyonin TaxID=3156615 RepID=UPI0032B574AC